MFPCTSQYAKWMQGMLLSGTFGDSLMGAWKVEERIVTRLPVTVQLGVMAIVIGMLISLPVGIYSAIRQDYGLRLHRPNARHHRTGRPPTSGLGPS